MFKIITPFIIALFISASGFAQGKIYEELYERFGDIPSSMTSVELKGLIKSTNTLSDGNLKALDIMLGSDEVVVPIGKFVSGKNVTMIFIKVDTGLSKLFMHSKTLSTKTGEVIGVNNYLLSISKEADMAYDGSYKRDGDFLIFTNDEEKEGEWHATQVKYKLGKTLSFEENMD